MRLRHVLATLIGAFVFATLLLVATLLLLLISDHINRIEQEVEDLTGIVSSLEAQKPPVSDDLQTPTQDTPEPEKWPWGAREPGWEDAQRDPETYVRWLEEENPGYSVRTFTKGEVTAYTPGVESCGEFADGITAVGADASHPGIAVPSALLKRLRNHSVKVVVPGYGQYVPDDTGGALNRSWEEDNEFHVDIRFQQVQTCYEWGRKYGVLFFLVPD